MKKNNSKIPKPLASSTTFKKTKPDTWSPASEQGTFLECVIENENFLEISGIPSFLLSASCSEGASASENDTDNILADETCDLGKYLIPDIDEHMISPKKKVSPATVTVAEDLEELHDITLEQANMTSSFSEEPAEDLVAAGPRVHSVDPILEVDEDVISILKVDEEAILEDDEEGNKEYNKWEHPTFSSPEAEKMISPPPPEVTTTKWEHPTFSSPEPEKECLSPTLVPSQEELPEALSPLHQSIDLDISDGVIELNDSDIRSEEGKLMNTESVLVDEEIEDDIEEEEEEVKDISGIVAELEEEFASHNIEDISIHDETEMKDATDLEEDEVALNDDTAIECDTKVEDDDIKLNFSTQQYALPETDDTLKLPVIANDVTLTTQKWEHPTFSSPQKEHKLSEHPTFSSPPPAEKLPEPVINQLSKHTKRIVFPPNFTVSKACPVGLNQRVLLEMKNTTNLWVQCNIRVDELGRRNGFSVQDKLIIPPNCTEVLPVCLCAEKSGLCQGSISFEGSSVVGNLLSSECGTCCITAIAETPALILQPELLNFGVQTLNKKVIFSLKNCSEYDIPVKVSVRSDEEVFSLENPNSVYPALAYRYLLRAGEMYVSSVEFTPEDRCTECTGRLTVEVDGPNGGLLCSSRIAATVGHHKLHISVKKHTLQLETTPGVPISTTVPFRNTGNIPVAVTLKATPPFSVTPTTIPCLVPGEECVCDVTYFPSHCTLDSGRLTLSLDEDVIVYEVPITAKSQSLQSLLLANKTMVNFGEGPIGHPVQQTILLKNSSTTDLMLLMLQVNSASRAFSILQGQHNRQFCDVILPAGASHLVTLSYLPSFLGQEAGELWVRSKSNNASFCIPLSGYGIVIKEKAPRRSLGTLSQHSNNVNIIPNPKAHAAHEVKKNFTTWRFSVKKLEMKQRKVNFFLVNECNKSLVFDIGFEAHLVDVTPTTGCIAEYGVTEISVTLRAMSTKQSSTSLAVIAGGLQQYLDITIPDTSLRTPPVKPSAALTPPPVVPPLSNTISFSSIPPNGTSTEFFTFHNVYPAEVRWEICSQAPPYCVTTAEPTRVNHPVFQFSAITGALPVGAEDKIPVMFYPKDPGTYTQCWILSFNIGEKQTTHTQCIIVEGVCESGKGEDGPCAKNIFTTQTSEEENTKSSGVTPDTQPDNIPPSNEKAAPRSRRPKRKEVYLKQTTLNFNTKANTVASVCFKLCNSTDTTQKIKLSSLKAPFELKYKEVSVKAAHSAKVPIHFRPGTTGVSSVVLVLTKEGGDTISLDITAIAR